MVEEAQEAAKIIQAKWGEHPIAWFGRVSNPAQESKSRLKSVHQTPYL
jgi:hypothetical protein